jgi:putative drug exporter of the RND superfamily
MPRGAELANTAEAKGFFGRLAMFILRWPWVVIGFWVALAAVLSVTFPPLTEMASKRPVAILPSDAPVLVTTRQISEAFHQSGSENENVLLVVLTDDTGLSRADEATYRALADNLRPDTEDIVMLQDFVSTPALREAMTSKDHKAWYLPMVLAGTVGSPAMHAAYGRIADIVKDTVAGSTLTANLTGPAATGDDLMFIGIRDMHVIELAVVIMVLVILLVIYRNPITMLLPLITIGVSVGVAQAIVAGVAELGLGVTSQTITFMTTMMAGAGIDYAVFLISRYHDYLRLGATSDQAILGALTSIGKVIAGSAATVSVTFLGMVFTHLGAFRTVGPALAISIAVALLAALTFLPALMVLAGPRGWIRPRRDLTSRFWRRTGIHIVRRPVSHLVVSLTVLVILAGCATLARYNYDDSKTLPQNVESAVGYATLAEHFPLNATIPEYLVVQSPVDLRKPDALADLKRMEQRVKDMPDIATIRGAPPPTKKSTGQTSSDGSDATNSSSGSAGGVGTLGESRGGGADAFPNVTATLYQLANLDSPSPLDDQGKASGQVDDAAMFVDTVRALGFAMSLDIAEIENTLNAAPVTVLDVGATTASDGGALQKISGFADKLSALPQAKTIEAAAQSMRQILNEASSDLRAMGIGDPNDVKDRQPPPLKDAHTFPEAIRQLLDGVKALVHQTTHIAGGLTAALTSFISPDGHTARYLVQTKLNPFGTDGMDQIRRIVDTAKGPHPDATLANASVSVSGVTAMLRDTRDYYNQDIRLIIGMTILIVFLILVALLRAIVAPLYLIATVVISYLSALGVGVVFFQFLLHQEVTWSLPGLTFIVLVAMGADYNLLLISRLREESPHGLRSGVIRTVGSTGGVITAAGVIFAASMFGLEFASISTLVQSGFIVGTGLLLDTFLVRTITVPAIAVLVGKANWWPSRLPPPTPRRRTPRVPAPAVAPASEPPAAGRHEKPDDVAEDTKPDIVALRS